MRGGVEKGTPMPGRLAPRWLAVATLVALTGALLPMPGPPWPAESAVLAPAPAADAAPTPEPAGAPVPAAGGAPAGDAAPMELAQPKPKLPPRHKPGRRSRSYNPDMRDPQALARAQADGYRGPSAAPIDELLANGALTDPLAGNARILPREQVIFLHDTFGAAN